MRAGARLDWRRRRREREGRVFFSPALGPDASAAALKRESGAASVYGCTTAGELGPEGNADGGAVAIAFRARDFTVAAKPIEEVGASTLEGLSRNIAGARTASRRWTRCNSRSARPFPPPPSPPTIRPP